MALEHCAGLGPVPVACFVLGESTVANVRKLSVAFPQAVGKDVRIQQGVDPEGYEVATPERKGAPLTRVLYANVEASDFSPELRKAWAGDAIFWGVRGASGEPQMTPPRGEPPEDVAGGDLRDPEGVDG